MNLTPKQLKILKLIRDSRVRRGFSPTMQEIADDLGVSKVTVFEHVEALIRKGALIREANKARSLSIPDGIVVPDEESIVTTGPYRWIRHPNYLVVILEVAALPLVHTAWASALVLSLLNAGVLWRRIRREEQALAQIPAWREAMATRKRLLPWIL